MSVKKIKGMLGELDKKFPGFQGAFFFYGYDENFAWHDGELIFSSSDILSGEEKIIKHPLVTKWTKPRWENDGHCRRNRMAMTHFGQDVRVIKRGVLYGDARTFAIEFVRVVKPFWHFGGGKVPEAVRSNFEELYKEVAELWSKKTILRNSRNKYPDNFEKVLGDVLTAKFSRLGVFHFPQIPQDLTVSVEEVFSDLWAERETLGTILVPGVGRKTISRTKRLSTTQHNLEIDSPYITLSRDEFLSVSADWDEVQKMYSNSFSVIIEGVESPEPEGWGMQCTMVRDPLLKRVDHRNFGELRECIMKHWSVV